MKSLLVLLALLLAPSAAMSSVPSFSIKDATAVESAGVITFEIDKSKASSTYSTVYFTTKATGSAKSGADYQATAGSVRFDAGVLVRRVSVKVYDNSIVDGTRTFAAVITPLRMALIGRGMATGTITDNDVPLPPPPPPPTQTCADGTIIPATSTCPVVVPPPPALTWVAAPLQDGSFARVKANDGLWDLTGPGSGRQLQAGEIVAVYFNGWGSEANGKTSFAIYALSDGTSGRAYAADLEGVAPVGTPPGLPADWWVPGLVNANKTCSDARADHAGQPGVVQGGVYRAAMLAGSHKSLGIGVSGDQTVMWQVFASGAQRYSSGFVVVTGDCLTGQ